MTTEKLDPDFADLPNAVRAEIEGLSGIGLHHAPEADAAFHHPETDRAGTEWEPDWEPIETYPGGVVMLDDGARQVLALRRDGAWFERHADGETALGDYAPMLWSAAPDRVERDML